MNKNELKAMLMIAEKMNWLQKSVDEVAETVKQMVRNQQALELDTVGDCDGDEETLLTMALWDRDRLVSAMHVCDYLILCEWNWDCLCEDFGKATEDMLAMAVYAEHSVELLIEEMEKAEEEEHYYNMMYDELNWYNHARRMGWE